ncbi:hypothetical protein [Kineococcus sp. SYSU DK002]|uniref:hypothetical protein n=1 Tax=Kineococcus sp. SYSU DK002 TaxID=3383123 RepID=UPI003D7DEE4D
MKTTAAAAGAALLSVLPVAARGSGPLLVPAPTGPEGASPAALVSGVVEEHDDCTTLGGPPILWPSGSTWDATAQTTTVPHHEGGADEVVVRIGRHVACPGGSW